MVATELNVIDENTSDAKLPDACPICDGALDVRVSPDGVFTACRQCHFLGRGELVRDGEGMHLTLTTTAEA